MFQKTNCTSLLIHHVNKEEILALTLFPLAPHSLFQIGTILLTRVSRLKITNNLCVCPNRIYVPESVAIRQSETTQSSWTSTSTFIDKGRFLWFEALIIRRSILWASEAKDGARGKDFQIYHDMMLGIIGWRRSSSRSCLTKVQRIAHHVEATYTGLGPILVLPQNPERSTKPTSWGTTNSCMAPHLHRDCQGRAGVHAAR